jgi:AcrR family transcriptional regulator
MTGERRLRTQERKTQIINATLPLIAERGVAGTTVQRNLIVT